MDPDSRLSASPPDDGRYRLLVEAVTDYAIYMLDPQGRVTSWNAGAHRFKGYQAAEIVGQHFSRFYSEEDRRAGLPARALADAEREGKFEGEGWRVRRDGTRFWAHVAMDPIRAVDGSLIGFATITRDLTERREAEERLRRSQEQFRLLVRGVTDYAIYMLDTEGRVSSWNAGAERIKGYVEEEILGKHFSQFYRPEDRHNDHPAKALATAAREGRFESEGWRVRKNGTHFWASVVVDAIRDERGTLIGFAKITRDVTAKRDAQRALQSAQESLFQSQKMDAIGQLTGGVAHDFNNLLMVIVSSLELVRRLPKDDPRHAKFVDNAIQAAKRGASLTQRMLSFARQQELKPSSVDVPDLVRGIAELLQRSIGPSVSLRIPFKAGLPRVHVDANQLELAILNLVVNARDAMPEGGTITIVNEDADAPPEGSRMPPGPCLRLSIIDTGSGMDAATLARATEPFFTTKGVGKGTGLGLSMVQGLAEQSGGQFVLRSEVGRGTTAELWLPLADPAARSAASSAAEPHVEPSQRRVTVLAVDDDMLVLSNAVAMLEALGHTAFGATSAQEALAVLREQPGIEVVLTDQAMPELTGVELIELARQDRPELRIILASGYPQLKTVLPPGVVRLSKPFGIESLAAALAQSVTLAT
jgi:PAS domain S-box-containing protein